MDPLADTAELNVADEFEKLGDKHFAPTPARTRMTFAALSHVGKVRTNNEDHYAVVRRYRARDVLFTNLPEDFLRQSRDESYAMVVADGMGGAVFGELASMLALRTAWDLTTNAINWPFRVNDRESEKILEQLNVYGKKMHEALLERGRADPAFAGMGSTFTGVLLIGTDAFIGHIGDSRAYVMRGGCFQRLTRDHTKAQEFVDAGLFASVAEAPPVMRHMLVNCLGGNGEDVHVETMHLPLVQGDKLLLCTDGLSDMVADSQIASILDQYPAPADACLALVNAALEHGGRDNVTVVLGYVAVAKPDSSRKP